MNTTGRRGPRAVESANGQPAAEEMLTRVPRGMALLYAGNRLTTVPDEVADAFRPGDRLLVVQTTGDVLHLPAGVFDAAQAAVAGALRAFARLQRAPAEAIDGFYETFARRLEDAAVWRAIEDANRQDVAAARERGRSTARLVANAGMRQKMIEGLRLWRRLPPARDAVVETIAHAGWHVEVVKAGLGVIGFVFESRPNVFADATGVLRGGNAAVLRIGSDALATARAIAQRALVPALQDAGLPEEAVTLLDRPERAAGWSLFAQPELSLAVARGSGQAVTQLGAIARQSGVPTSLHGTGGAWIIADVTADPQHLEMAVYNSLDSKKCNTLNTLCLDASAAPALAPAALAAIDRRGQTLGAGYKLHVTQRAQAYLPKALFSQRAPINRPAGVSHEPVAELIDDDRLDVEWDWDATPELSLCVVDGLDDAIERFNRLSPRFVASLISADPAAHDRLFQAIDAPFVGNGFTRWVDGQFALRRPELGLSNWQGGRLFARSGVLSGSDVYTLRLRAVQHDPDVHV